jgi:serine protease Do
MKRFTIAAGLVVLAGVGAFAQGRLSDSGQDRGERSARDLMLLAGRGTEIGVSVADGPTAGVVVEEVRPDSPAEKAGLQRSDVIVEFDGEHVRSARQFRRLVQETPPVRTVRATIVRDGQKKDVQITPAQGRTARGDVFLDGDRLLEPLEHLRGRIPPFNFDFDLPGALSGQRLGVTIDELSDQLAAYFGVSDGLLVTSVTDGSAASRAGLKAGDVITSIDGRPLHSRGDLIRALRDAGSDEIAIGIVRDKREISVTVKLEAPRRPRGRPA